MKKTIFSSLFCGALIASSLANFANNNQQAPIINNPLNRMVIVDDGGGGGGGPSIPNYYGFNRKQFFENSTKYQPFNKIGTCGYISLMQLLSFYDTFYNDSIIPDQYDRSYQTATTLADAVRYSPGVEPIASSDYPCGGEKDKTNPYNSSLYRNFCYDRQSFCFQSYLGILDNQARGLDDNTHFDHGNQFKHYQKILDQLYGEDKAIVSVYDSSDQNVLKQKIKDFIDGGDPVLVSLVNDSDPDEDNWYYHAVVAYDYSGDTIYANFGYSYTGSSHMSLFDSREGYLAIRNIATINFNKMGPKHSDNYVINGHSYCGCCGYRTDYLNDTQDHLAASFGGSVKKVTWTRPINGRAEFVDLHVVNSAGFEILKKEHIEYNEYIFTDDEWNNIILFAGSRVGFYVTGYADPSYFLWWVTGYNTIKSTITYYKSVSGTPSYDRSLSYAASAGGRPVYLEYDNSKPFNTYRISVSSAVTKTYYAAAGQFLIIIVNASTGKVYLGVSHDENSRVIRIKFDTGTYYARVYALTSSVSIKVS